MRWTTPLAITFLLTALYGATGCATHPAPPPPVATPTCLPLKPYTKAQQQEAASELSQLPQGSEVAQMIVDYGAMRDADRACQGK